MASICLSDPVWQSGPGEGQHHVREQARGRGVADLGRDRVDRDAIPSRTRDLEAQAREFPDVRFLVLSGPATPGERVNVGISEARAPRVFRDRLVWTAPAS